MDKPSADQLRHRMMATILRGSIAEQIKSMRLNRGLSQKQLAKALKTAQANVSGWEDPFGEWMTVETLQRIANYFDVALRIEFSGWQEFMQTYCTGKPLQVPPPFPAEAV